MTENNKNENHLNGEEDSFSDLLEKYDSGQKNDLNVGDKISGKIIAIGQDTVFVDTGSKLDGMVDKSTLLDENGEFPYEVGHELNLFVVSTNNDEIILSNVISGINDFALLKNAYENEIPVEGKVVEQCKGGFNIEIMEKRAFCPISQIDAIYVENPEEYLGQTLSFQIIKFEEKGRNLVVSRRQLIQKAQEESKKGFLTNLKVGSIVEAEIKKLMDFGAFAELFPGVEGMIHISEISWSRVNNTQDALEKGQKVKAVVLEIQNEPKLKISLSMKQISENPWHKQDLGIKAGDKINGKVVRLAKFGAFIEIFPGIEGLCHISEMSYIKRILKPEDILNIGDEVDVMVKDIDMDNKKISLSLRDAEGDPWIGIEKKFKTGESITGKIYKKEKFGFFINLSPGITGLLPLSLINKTHKPSKITRLKEGDEITVIIGDINKQKRKIALAPGDSSDEDNWQSYSTMNSGKKSGNEPSGTMAEQLQQFLNK